MLGSIGKIVSAPSDKMQMWEMKINILSTFSLSHYHTAHIITLNQLIYFLCQFPVFVRNDISRIVGRQPYFNSIPNICP
jgi:hypothetical protein